MLELVVYELFQFASYIQPHLLKNDGLIQIIYSITSPTLLIFHYLLLILSYDNIETYGLNCV